MRSHVSQLSGAFYRQHDGTTFQFSEFVAAAVRWESPCTNYRKVQELFLITEDRLAA
jgi:hypothetical protein